MSLFGGMEQLLTMKYFKYYVYENLKAEGIIHRGSCDYCNEGKGSRKKSLGGFHGKWHGPFDSLKEAGRGIGLGRVISKCRCLKGGKNLNP